MVVASSIYVRLVPVRSKVRSWTFCRLTPVRGLQLIDEDTHVHFFVVPDSRPLYNGHRKMSNQKENTIMNIDESIFSRLTDEQKKKVEAAQTPEDFLAIAKEAGYELSPEQLEAAAGGKWEPCWKNNCSQLDPCSYFS